MDAGYRSIKSGFGGCFHFKLSPGLTLMRWFIFYIPLLCLPSQDATRVNTISYEEILANLCALLVEDTSCIVCPLPTNLDTQAVLESSSGELVDNENDVVAEVGKYYIT